MESPSIVFLWMHLQCIDRCEFSMYCFKSISKQSIPTEPPADFQQCNHSEAFHVQIVQSSHQVEFVYVDEQERSVIQR